jgi:hypothetical protein
MFTGAFALAANEFLPRQATSPPTNSAPHQCLRPDANVAQGSGLASFRNAEGRTFDAFALSKRIKISTRLAGVRYALCPLCLCGFILSTPEVLFNHKGTMDTKRSLHRTRSLYFHIHFFLKKNDCDSLLCE